MPPVSELDTPTQSMTNLGNLESQKTFRVPTQPVDGKGEVVAFIGPGVEFKGEIYYEGSVQIDGTLEGQIHTGGVLLVGEQAVINAKVHAGSVISKGKVNGNIEASKQVQLLSTAVMDGALKTPELSMEIGVIFNGDISMGSAAGAANDSPQKYKEQNSYQKPNGNTSNMTKPNKGPETTTESADVSGGKASTDKSSTDGSASKPSSGSPSK